ncbi:O-methyltransferase [Terriglobus roseus]|uniref:Methyltransferase domain-containing protein n=1 Tax=Terriglobus roseus TaxID=392734 RepID=A0A1H4KM99_9BACT|nr:class I SAM-dependent methyltransferase [Terriglobus roseus]SEB59366.1 Methyltransferase domain-containing protein [Terriglobus roseus]
MEDSHSKAPERLDHILKRTDELKFSMASEPLAGCLLRALAASKPSGRFLELGTGTGLSTAWLLDGMDAEATLISVDLDPSVQQVAAQCLGNDPRLSLEVADGIEFLQRQPAASFDFVFADAMPGKYEGVEHALAVVKPGGFYVIDDMLAQSNWPEGHAAKVSLLMALLAADTRFHIVPMDWASGMVLAVRKS